MLSGRYLSSLPERAEPDCPVKKPKKPLTGFYAGKWIGLWLIASYFSYVLIQPQWPVHHNSVFDYYPFWGGLVLATLIIWWRWKTDLKDMDVKSSDLRLLVFASYFWCLVAFLMTIQILNYCLDFSPPLSRRVKIINKFEGRMSRYFVVKDWRNSANTVQFQVSEKNFSRYEANDVIVIKTKKGFLGLEWVEKFK